MIDKDPNHELVVAELNGEIIGTLHLMLLPSISYQGELRARQRDCHLMQLISHKSRLARMRTGFTKDWALSNLRKVL